MKSSQQTATFRTIAQGELRSQGFDSIEFNPGDGQEVVIFNSNRVPQSNSLCVKVCDVVMQFFAVCDVMISDDLMADFVIWCLAKVKSMKEIPYNNAWRPEYNVR